MSLGEDADRRFFLWEQGYLNGAPLKVLYHSSLSCSLPLILSRCMAFCGCRVRRSCSSMWATLSLAFASASSAIDLKSHLSTPHVRTSFLLITASIIVSHPNVVNVDHTHDTRAVLGSVGAFVPFRAIEDVEFFHTLQLLLRESLESSSARRHMRFRSTYFPVLVRQGHGVSSLYESLILYPAFFFFLFFRSRV